jgi:hypothetical protein
VARTLCIRIPDTPIPDMPNSDSPGSSATCSRPDRRFRSIREIATRDFTRCRTLTLSIPERRNPEVRWTLVLHTCTHGLSPAQLLHDRTVLGISRNFPGITSRRFFLAQFPYHWNSDDQNVDGARPFATCPRRRTAMIVPGFFLRCSRLFPSA